MPLNIKNLAYIRSAGEWDPELAGRMYEALQSIAIAHNNVETQTNGNATGEPEPPPSPMGIQVSSRDGYLHVALNDQGPLFRGVQYWVQHASTPNFTDAIHTQASGTELRNHTEFIGNKSYPWSAPTNPVIHGGTTPIAVVGGGSVAGPLFLPPQGTGTSPQGGAVSGPGTVAFRSSTGIPPTR